MLQFAGTSYRMLASLLSTPIVQRHFIRNPLVLTYHMVSDAPRPHLDEIYYTMPVSQFTADLDLLQKQFSIISQSDLVESLNGGRDLPRNACLVTFDDGYREVFDVVRPILLARGVPATFFLSTAFIGNRQMCHEQKASLLINRAKALAPTALRKLFLEAGIEPAEPVWMTLANVHDPRLEELYPRLAELLGCDFQAYLEGERPYLTNEQVKQLALDGFCLGAHGVDHHFFATLPYQEQLAQARNSIAALKNYCSQSCYPLAFPYNDVGISSSFFTQMAKEGVGPFFGTNGQSREPRKDHFQRCLCDFNDFGLRARLSLVLLRRVMISAMGRSVIRRAQVAS